MAKAKKKAFRPTEHHPKRSSTTARTVAMVAIVADDYPVRDVARHLEKAGFEVDQVLEVINQVTGRAGPHLKKKFESVKGVKKIQQMHKGFDIGPPDSDVS